MNKETRDLLELRAIAMAKEPEQKKSDSPVIQLITFTLASEIYGIESSYIREVYQLKDFTPLPGVPAYILGVINVRSQIIPVIDLKKLFKLPEQGLTELNKVIILHDEHMEFGILADVVMSNQAVAIDEIKKAPLSLKGIGQEYLKGVTVKGLIVLDAERLLNDKSIVVDDAVD